MKSVEFFAPRPVSARRSGCHRGRAIGASGRRGPRLPATLATLVLLFLPAVASAHFQNRLTTTFRERTALQQTMNALTSGHVDVDDMAMTPKGDWVIVAGTEVHHSGGFPPEILATIEEFLDAGRTIDAVAVSPSCAWVVAAGDLHRIGGHILRGAELDAVLTDFLGQGLRVTDLVFDADNNGWSVVAGGSAFTRNMPREFFDAILERHPGRRTIRQMEMGFDGRWIVIADQWFASHGLSERQRNRLGRFQRARLGLDHYLLGRVDDYVLYSHGGVVPDLSSPMDRVEYDLGSSRRNVWERMAETHTPGLSIAVVENNRVRWARGYGVLESGTERWVRASSPFAAASVSKFMGAMTISALADDGVLDFDADITSYAGAGTALEEWLHAVGPLEGETTLVHLLSHTAGLLPHGSKSFAVGAEIPGTLDLLLGAYSCDGGICDYSSSSKVRPYGKAPGEESRYSGGGFLVAEAVAEAATGRSFDELIAEKLFDPLGMADTGVANPLPAELRARSSVAHNAKGEPLATREYPWTAAGGIFASASDVARALVPLLNRGRGEDGTVILSEEAVERTLTNQAPDATYGLGVDLLSKVVNEEQGGSIRHNGAHRGARALFVANPKLNQAFVVMEASEPPNQSLLFQAVAALKCAYGWGEC